MKYPPSEIVVEYRIYSMAVFDMEDGFLSSVFPMKKWHDWLTIPYISPFLHHLLNLHGTIFHFPLAMMASQGIFSPQKATKAPWSALQPGLRQRSPWSRWSAKIVTQRRISALSCGPWSLTIKHGGFRTGCLRVKMGNLRTMICKWWASTSILVYRRAKRVKGSLAG